MLHKVRTSFWACFTTVFLALGCTSSPAQIQTSEAVPAAPDHTRILLIGLDGIPLSTFKKLQDGGHFRQFKAPGAMVATFPSISDPNWARLLKAPLEESYTKGHFSWKAGPGGGLVGSLTDNVFRPPRYEKLFNFRPEGMIEHLGNLAWSETTAFYWLDALEKDFLNADPEKDYSAFFLNTDLIAHTKGEKHLMEFLVRLDHRIERIVKEHRQKFKEPLEVILVSDHGNGFYSPKPIFPDEVLKDRHWNVGTSVQTDRDVAYVFPEILSFAAMYCKPASRLNLVKDLVGIKGVHTAFFESAPNTIDVYAVDGQTRIEIDPKEKTVSYKIVKGQDPFGQIGSFKKNSKLSWQEYFNSSIGTTYPNALVRAWEAFHVNSQVPASVLLDPVQGYVFANRTLNLLTVFFGLKSIHGSFERNESLGIAVSTDRELPNITPDQLMDITGFRR